MGRRKAQKGGTRTKRKIKLAIQERKLEYVVIANYPNNKNPVNYVHGAIEFISA